LARVAADELDRIRRELAREGRPYGSRELGVLIIDCDYGLETAGFERGRSRKTGEAERMVVFQFAAPADAATPDEVAARLEAGWLRDGAFTHEAHTLSVDGPKIVLDFVSWWDDGAFSTGCIEVAAPR
jgi:hypothetical protein